MRLVERTLIMRCLNRNSYNEVSKEERSYNEVSKEELL